jgi:biotin carboxyl carrier protein
VGYYRPAKNPLQVGLEVKAGDVVAEILALGLKNDVLSKWNGIVAQVLVTPEQPVEFGQAIAVLTLEK